MASRFVFDRFRSYDLPLVEAVVNSAKISVIAPGGAGIYQHMVEGVEPAGAAGYLGCAMSRAILEAGADLIVTGRRKNVLNALRDALPTELQEHCYVIVGDVTHIDTPVYLKLQIEARFGQLHGIVNNAYAGKVGVIDSIEAEDFFTACAYNLVAPFALVKALAPFLETSAKNCQASASVVNVASMYGTVSPDPSIYADSGQNNPIHYGASKGGMIQMSRYLACHLGQ